MSGKMYGYARVSTRMQNEDRQLIALTQFGVAEDDIVVEKQSGKDFLRPLYLGLVEKMRPGDVLVVKSIDRLGRSYEEILAQWAILTKDKKIAIVVLDMPLLDTREGRDLTGMLVADIVLQLLSYVAQTERDVMRQRQAEGIAAAKARGVRFGRERVSMPDDFAELAEDWWHCRVSATPAGKEIGVSRDTFLRRAKEWGAANGYTERVQPALHDLVGFEENPQNLPEVGDCGSEETAVCYGHGSSQTAPVSQSAAQEVPVEQRTPQEQTDIPTGGFPMNDVKITYVNHSGNKDNPTVFLFTKNEVPTFDALKDGVAWRTFERIGRGSSASAVFPINTEVSAAWDGGSCKTAQLTADIGSKYKVSKDSTGIVLAKDGNAAASTAIDVVSDVQVDGGISVNLYKDGRIMMTKNIVAYGQKATFVLHPKLYWGLASEIQEGGQLSSAVLNSASFFELGLEGLTAVTVGLYGNAQDGYEFKVDSKN